MLLFNRGNLFQLLSIIDDVSIHRKNGKGPQKKVETGQ